MSTYYIEDGLLKFQALKNDKLKIITTYDNKIWGNMNPFFARSEEEKLRIEQNDNKIDTNLCTYEEVEKGNLFSHKYVTDNKQKEIEVPEGNYNVVVNI